MAKRTQAICQLLPTKYLSVFDDFVELTFKGLTYFLLMLSFISMLFDYSTLFVPEF